MATAGGVPAADQGTWTFYKCVPSYSYDSPRSVVTMILSSPGENASPDCRPWFTPGNPSNEVDGCSISAGAYEWAWTPACSLHDACYAWAKRPPLNWPANDESRKRCDNEMFSRLESACNTFHCDTWWKKAFGECDMCMSQLSYWKAFLPLKVGNGLRDGRWGDSEVPNFYHSFGTAYGDRMPAELRWVETFRQSQGPIRSMMHGMCIDVPTWNAGELQPQPAVRGSRMCSRMWPCCGPTIMSLKLRTALKEDGVVTPDRPKPLRSHHQPGRLLRHDRGTCVFTPACSMQSTGLSCFGQTKFCAWVSANTNNRAFCPHPLCLPPALAPSPSSPPPPPELCVCRCEGLYVSLPWRTQPAMEAPGWEQGGPAAGDLV